ncbi:MAG: hypothetical protein NVSMB51_16740 [Solirubrobacteraceae bacterium]
MVLLLSLFLDWYAPGGTAWAVFEVWDLVLAGLSVLALLAVAGRLGMARGRPDSWLAGPSIAALVIVVAALLDHPPAARAADPKLGIWLALAAALTMVCGVAMAVARISVAIRVEGDRRDAAVGAPGRRAFPRRRPTAPAPAPSPAPRAGQPAAGDSETEATRVIDPAPGERR